jgi:hypothetical protein
MPDQNPRLLGYGVDDAFSHFAADVLVVQVVGHLLEVPDQRSFRKPSEES